MSVYHVRLPDVGEGIAEAELVTWLVAVGDEVTQESALAEVLTDKATVQISSPVDGRIVYLAGNEGEVMAVGTEFVGIEIEGGDPPQPEVPVTPDAVVADAVAPDGLAADPVAPDGLVAEPAEPVATVVAPTVADRAEANRAEAPPDLARSTRAINGRALAAPAVRRRAHELGIDLATVAGSGPDGRVLHRDLDRLVAGSHQPLLANDATRETPIRGLRRRIGQRLSEAWSEIPHITYVDEIDATELEALRSALNAQRSDGKRLTMLPFLAKAIVLACADHPECNADYNSGDEVLTESGAVHLGVAAETPNGLVVPVLRHAEARGLWDAAAEIARLAAAARDGSATAEELSGSTITVTSLGAMGGLMTTPIINRPEVTIVGVNKLQVRPVWRDGAFVPRSMFNLSSSFDHRIIDGWVAAEFVQRIKAVLETPALLFTGG